MLDAVLRETRQGNARLVQSYFNIHQNGLEDGTEAQEAGVWREANIVVKEKSHIAIALLLELQLTRENKVEGGLSRPLQGNSHLSIICIKRGNSCKNKLSKHKRTATNSISGWGRQTIP